MSGAIQKSLLAVLLILSACNRCQPQQQRANAALAAMHYNREAGAELEQSIVAIEDRLRQCEATHRDRASCTSLAVRAEYHKLKAMHRETEQRADKLLNDYQSELSRLTICQRDN